jgi:LacI family transcriptional regulator
MSYALPTVSLKDIATELDVSISLVSKVLNNRLGNTRVSEELAAKIRKVAKELKYRKNSSALSLRSGFHNSISVMIHRHGEKGSPMVDYMVQGVFERADEYNQKLMLGFFETKAEFMEICESAHRGLVDGLIIGGVPHEELRDSILQLKEDGLPMVTILEEKLFGDIPNMDINMSSIGKIATEHLIEQGCTSVGHLEVLEPRSKGYKAALNEAGLAYEEKWVYPCNRPDQFSYATGVKAAEYFLKLGEIPDGIVAQSDAFAAGLMNTFRMAGIICPDDVKIIGVDDSPFCEYSLPSLSSINQQNYPRGKQAVESLMQIRDGKSVDSKVFEPKLKPRASTGCEGVEISTEDIPR